MTERSPGVWRLRFRATGPSGKPVQRQRTFIGSEADARKGLSKLVAEANAGQVASGKLTVGDCLDQWLSHCQFRGRRPSTIAENRRKIEKTIRPRLGSIPLAKLRPRDLDNAYDAWQASGLSPTTVHHYHAILSAALNLAVRRGDLPSSPAARSEPPPNRSKVPTVPTIEELDMLIRTAAESDPVFATVIAIAALTGARRGELAALRWSDVDLTAGTVTIAKSLTVTGSRSEKLFHVGPTKTKQQRRVSVGARGVELLAQLWMDMVELSEKAGSPLVDDPYVFARPYHVNASEPCLPDTWTSKFSALCDKAGVRHFRFHDLRHWNVTQLIGGGHDVRTVSGRVGHSAASMTLDRYSHALPAGDKRAADYLGQMLSSSGGETSEHPEAIA